VPRRQGHEHSCGENEAVEDHMARAELGESDFAEWKAHAPEHAGTDEGR
jgi:hypothetical protein